MLRTDEKPLYENIKDNYSVKTLEYKMLNLLPNQIYETYFRHEMSSDSAAETLATNYFSLI